MVTSESGMRELSDEELLEMLQNAAQEGPEIANQFFGRFSYSLELFNGNHSTALHQGITLLSKCRSLDKEAYAEIHKGTPFYWLGTAAFLLHDYQTAVFFYDAAVSEDLRAGADPYDNITPALRFIQIDGDPQEQAARELVREAQAQVDLAINHYNSKSGLPQGFQPITIDDIRLHFLVPSTTVGCEGWRSLATTFISFFLERAYRIALLDLRDSIGTAEPFFIHLFKGCVLFESLLKANPTCPISPHAQTMGAVLQELHQTLGIPHNIRISQAHFPTILQNLENADDSIQTAIEYTGRVRNTVGHDLGWAVNLQSRHYTQLFSMISASCLHAIACLYR